jgi:heptosyltransferase-2
MQTLIAKLGATGDVVRTTPLLDRLGGQVVWLTEAKNKALFTGSSRELQCFSWEERELIPDANYDLVVNLEDTLEVATYLKRFKYKKWFGAYANSGDSLRYTENSARWFDLSLISAYGKKEADLRKFRNRSTYQEMIFAGLGFRFAGETYFLPQPIGTALSGDVAIAADSGPVWPMKKWAYYDELKQRLEHERLTVNILPKRASLLEHLSDIEKHRCLVGGDSLPMHLALGMRKRCVTLFTCTSPWEIYGYGVQTQIVSPLLEQFFYKREYDERATTAISVREVFEAVMSQVEATTAACRRAAVK